MPNNLSSSLKTRTVNEGCSIQKSARRGDRGSAEQIASRRSNGTRDSGAKSDLSKVQALSGYEKHGLEGKHDSDRILKQVALHGSGKHSSVLTYRPHASGEGCGTESVPGWSEKHGQHEVCTSTTGAKPGRMHSSKKQTFEKEPSTKERYGSSTKQESGRIRASLSEPRKLTLGGYKSFQNPRNKRGGVRGQDRGYCDHGDGDTLRPAGTGRSASTGISRPALSTLDPSRGGPSSGDERYEISVIVYGQGTGPHNRSHWAFIISRQGEYMGDVLEVILMDQRMLLYQYQEHLRRDMRSPQAEGRSIVAVCNRQLCERGVEVIRHERAPTDGRRRCRDWILAVLRRLETAEVVAPGTSQRWTPLVGMPVPQLAAALGRSWEAFPRVT